MKSHFKGGFGGLVFSLLVFAALLCFLVLAVGDADKNSDQKQMEFLSQALRRAAVSCYAIEGRYPATVQYMEDHYGVVIDHNKFIVDYDISFSNQVPVINVYVKK